MGKLIQLSEISWEQPFKDRRKERHLWGVPRAIWEKCNLKNGTKRLINIKFEDRFGINETRLFQITSGEISFPKDFINKIDKIVTNNPDSYFIVTILDNNLTDENAELILSKNELEQNELEKHIKNTYKSREKLIEELINSKPKEDETITINRIQYKRDNYTIALIKQVRGHKCQICSKEIITKEGTKYIEAAHIIAKSEKGKETPSNILLLCPNCHKEFDLGDRKIISHNKKAIEFSLNGTIHKIDLTIK
ncbi:MAG TPA: HNH endonuclease [Chitinophagales bacterium]|nr:HNH endonuclease [Chitinophagales bacterium]HNM31794.1 HNH endonuclease [Chitinophagales bacterium]